MTSVIGAGEIYHSSLLLDLLKCGHRGFETTHPMYRIVECSVIDG